MEKFSDQMPAKTWPKAEIPFYVIAGVYVALLVVGTVAMMLGVRGRTSVKQQGQTQTIEVAPSR